MYTNPGAFPQPAPTENHHASLLHGTPQYGLLPQVEALHTAGLPRPHREAPRFAVPYLRVSTEDKGQNPQRQLDVIRPWAEREGLVLLPAVVDEGTSASKTNPFERPKFLEACDLAQRTNAEAIVVELGDRFSRQGTKLSDWAEVELGIRYGLKLYRADSRVEDLGTLQGDLVQSIKAELAREFIRQHSARVRSGMARAKADGKRVGGAPPKPLTEDEMTMAITLRLSKGRGRNPVGWPTIAKEISRTRGALELTNISARRRLSVTANHVQRVVEAEMTTRGYTLPRTAWDRATRKNPNTDFTGGLRAHA